MFLNGNDRSRFNSCSLYAGLAAIIWKALLRKKDLGVVSSAVAFREWMFFRRACEMCRALSPWQLGAPAAASTHLFQRKHASVSKLPSFLVSVLLWRLFLSSWTFFLLFHSACASVWSARKHPLSAHSPAVVAWALECGRFYSGLMTNEGYNCLVFHTSVCPFASFFWHGCISSLDLRVGKIM